MEAPLICRRDLVLLALLTIAAGLPGLGSLSITREDERFYIQTVLSMPENGHYLVPTYYGYLHLGKPPLMNWLVLGMCKIFGFSLWASRLPSLLAGASVVALIYLLAVRLYRHALTAQLAGLMAASSYTMLVHSRLALTDMVMLAGMLMLYLNFIAVVSGEQSRRRFFLAAVGLGVVVMVKGHVGLILSTLPIAVFCIVERRILKETGTGVLFNPWFWCPALIFCFWWYAILLSTNTPASEFAAHHRPAEQSLSKAFVSFFQEDEINARASGGFSRIGENILRYPVDFLRISCPWSLLALAGFLFWGKPLFRDLAEKRRETVFLLCLVVPLFLFFTFVVRQPQRSRYLLPIVPGIVIFAARFIALKADAIPWAVNTARSLSLVLIVVFNILFVYVGPSVRQNPFEQLVMDLKPRVSADHVILVGGMWPKWHTYAGAILGRKTDFVGYTPNSDTIKHQLKLHEGETIYVLMDRTYFALWDKSVQDSFEIISERRGIEGRIEFRDLIDSLAGRELRKENTLNLMLLKYRIEPENEQR
ncbi:MAG: glycosyltransferase family 39 protein [Planctomycetota bacterium]|nr:glycosyltransferase family 39 protein [Planctomycetota bacterium]